MSISTKIYTKLNGKLKGRDDFGNSYYEDKKPDANGRIKRWVMYNGMKEASKVPPEWYGWLHYTTDKILSEKYDWQKPHLPNLTGTDLAYFPPGHKKDGNVLNKVKDAYKAWQPSDA